MSDWKKGVDYPEWYLDRSLITISKGYLQEGESPRDAYKRVANAAASRLQMPGLAKDFFDIMWKGWLGPASPVLSNMGTSRGMPISCFSLSIPDSVDGIYKSVHEMAMMTKLGGGVGLYSGNIRGRGEPIKGNGRSEGVVPWLKVFDSAILATNQGSVRRGAAAAYLPVEHLDIEEFARIRRPEGDINRHCMNLHHGVTISDEFMKGVESGDVESRQAFKEVIKNRFETGEPFIMFRDTVNNDNPECYKKNNLNVETSNICCLTGDTLVATSNGPKRIDSLVDSEVSIFDGKEWVNNSSFELKGSAYIYRVHMANGSYMDATSNHRWFVSRDYTEIRNNKYTEVVTESLESGMYLEYHSEQSHGELNESGAYLKGFLLGDGTSFRNKTTAVPKLTLYKNKYPCADKVMLELNKVPVDDNFRSDCIVKPGLGKERNYENTGHLGDNTHRNVQGLSSRKKELNNWCKEYKLGLPERHLQWNENTKKEFISGIFDADGSFSRGLQITLKEEAIIKDVKAIVSTFGFKSSIDYPKTGAGKMYRLSISLSDSFEMLKHFPFQRLKWQGAVPNRKLSTWRKVVKVELLEKEQPVYCPIVPSTGKFALANGIMTGNSEILLHTDKDHSFVCCLSSLNLSKYFEWKDWKSEGGHSLPYLTTYFLDAVLQEFIDKGQNIPGMERAIRSAIKGRAIGIGVMGWHSLLQQDGTAFESLRATMLNKSIFSFIRSEADSATKQLANTLGEPEWCKGFGIRNSHLLAVAPTTSNATICGGISPSIEPWIANAFNQKSAKGAFLVKNPQLEKLLTSLKKNTREVWESIVNMKGSVQHLDILTKEQKEIYLTAREIDQVALIDHAADRQKFIDQSQSLNLFFDVKADPRYVYQVHIRAWKKKIKTLYYMRTGSVLNANFKLPEENTEEDCKACEG